MANSRYDDRDGPRGQQGASDRNRRNRAQDDQDRPNWQSEGRGQQRQSDWNNPERYGHQDGRGAVDQRGYDVPPRGGNTGQQSGGYPEDGFIAGFGSRGGMMPGRPGYGSGPAGGRDRRDTDRYADQDRGMLSRAGDEIASWFGDEDAARRREQDHRGKGPRGYKRSDERIREDVSDRLSDDPRIDASEIDVTVESSEVTLAGEVSSKSARRHAEDCAEAVSGVVHVQNNLRVKRVGADLTGSSGTQI